MRNDINNEPAYSKSVIEFLTVAHEYCVSVENCKSIDPNNFKQITQKILPLLYLKGSLLPQVTPEDTESMVRFVNEEDWERIFRDLNAVFGKRDKIVILDKESSYEPKIAEVSLSEFLTDIYQDMKDFVLLYQQEKRSSKQCAVKEAYKLFHINWGKKATIALQALHEMNQITDGPKMSNFLDFLDE